MRLLLPDGRGNRADAPARSQRSDRARLKDLKRRHRARQPRRAHRVFAGVAAVLVNVTLIAVLASPPTPGSRGFGREVHEEPVTAFLLPAVDPLIIPAHLRWSPRHLNLQMAAPALPAILDLPSVQGPPTETIAAVLDEPDRQAVVLDTKQVQESCRRTYANEFTSEAADVTLRVYVMADGRIGQGKIVGSSGDGHLDWMTMKCLQAYAHLAPTTDEASEVGSWQRLIWNWSKP